MGDIPGELVRGFKVRYPSGSIEGSILDPMTEEEAAAYISREAERFGLDPESFELIPVEGYRRIFGHKENREGK